MATEFFSEPNYYLLLWVYFFPGFTTIATISGVMFTYLLTVLHFGRSLMMIQLDDGIQNQVHISGCTKDDSSLCYFSIFMLLYYLHCLQSEYSFLIF